MAPFLIVLTGYILGSIPSAVLVSRRAAGVDIREMGDANMGARNVSRTLGWQLGIAVALMDFGKGFCAVLLARALGLGLGWQMATAFAAVVGHDFPILAGFRGGQGLATTLGTLLALTPAAAACGLLIYGLAFAITRNSDLSASLGIALLVLLIWRLGEPVTLLIFSLVMILSIPGKLWLDRPRRARLRNC